MRKLLMRIISASQKKRELKLAASFAAVILAQREREQRNDRTEVDFDEIAGDANLLAKILIHKTYHNEQC